MNPKLFFLLLISPVNIVQYLAGKKLRIENGEFARNINGFEKSFPYGGRWLNVLLCSLFLCIVSHVHGQQAQLPKPQLSAAEILKTFDSYYLYEYQYLKLTEQYTAYDSSGHLISRNQFLQSLASGEYLPLKLGDKIYQLNKLPKKVDPEISGRLKDFGRQYLKYYQMEGKPLPDFDFVDLNGHRYNAQTTKGKILVLKCWFIHCQMCVQEIPALNEMVKKFKGRKDVVFVSLAFDAKKDLQAFLRKTPLSYAVIPDKRSYMVKKLGIDAYPTHLIIDRQGKIFKVLDSADQLIAAAKTL